MVDTISQNYWYTHVNIDRARIACVCVITFPKPSIYYFHFYVNFRYFSNEYYPNEAFIIYLKLPKYRQTYNNLKNEVIVGISKQPLLWPAPRDT